jgi:hypothetical protein
LDILVKSPDMTIYATVFQGVNTAKQIQFLGRFGKMGLKGNGTCTPQTSGATLTMTEKFWRPVLIEDLIKHCNAELDGLFKPYFTKVERARELFDIEGSDLAIVLALFVVDAIAETLERAAWFGDTDVAAADATTAGLVSAANVKFYDYIDGWFKQIIEGVTTGDIARVPIDENDEDTKALQMTLTAGRTLEILDAMTDIAPETLRSLDSETVILLSGHLFTNYQRTLRGINQAFSMEYTENGIALLRYDNKVVVDMRNIWDKARVDFVKDTTTNAYYLPHRAVMTVPQNLGIATLSMEDLASLRAWFSNDDNLNKIAWGFTLDAKVLKDDLIVVAY